MENSAIFPIFVHGMINLIIISGKMMNKNGRIIFVFFCINLISYNGLCQPANTFCQQGKTLLDLFNEYHYQSIKSKNELAQRTYRLFIQALDPHCLYFMAGDTNILALSKSLIKDDFNETTYPAFSKIIILYKQRLMKADSFVNQVLAKPLNFSLKDSIVYGDKDSLYFSLNEQSYRKRWNKWLTYQALLYLFSPDSANDKPFAKNNKQTLSKEPEVRNKIKVKETRTIKRILEHPEGFENYVASLFFNAVSTSFDPHSSYFSQVEKRNFESSLAKDVQSYGFDVEDDPGGTVKISRLVPGGPAWKSNEINKGDILIQLKWPNNQTVDFSCADENEVKGILQSSGSIQMELTDKKANGQLKTVKLRKEKLEADENLIRSYLLKGTKTIGFITLPGFYTEWENENITGCGNDMAREVIKLQKENIDGIIIDLRNNGGGAMNEALNLAGIFIDEGPLCLSRNKSKKIEILKDKNRGTAYDGPLIIMINGYSASASEIMAAALQDYNRAVIIGSTSFGKSSGQIIFQLDTLRLSESSGTDNNNMGFIKITVNKFYRLNGVSYQQKGVQPDVVLPSNESFSYHEVSYPYALSSDSVIKKIYYNPLPKLPVTILAAKSKQRIAADLQFKRIKNLNDSLQMSLSSLKAIPLNLESFRKREENIFLLMHNLENLAIRPSSLYHIANLKFDESIFKINPYKKEVNDILLKNVQNDIYVEEAYHIINDLINVK
jgi:carboxyl-terminal processing protease